MAANSSRICFAGLCVVWVAAVACGASWLLRYEARAGVAANAPVQLATQNSMSARARLPQLFLFIHPHCPCTRATLSELALLMTQCSGKLEATVLLVRPAAAPAKWEKTDLAATAAAIPGVKVFVDEGAHRARELGAATSGQTLLYAADGRLLFAGGITESRGHSGDNAGRAAIKALVLNPPSAGSSTAGSGLVGSTPVYGCHLFDQVRSPSATVGESCPK